jgi:drug/metabolite transporter (DMT)-like permease
MKVAVVLSLAILFAAAGDILFSRGMRSTGGVSLGAIRDIPPLARSLLTNYLILAGTVSMAIHLCAYITALTWVDVSIANPLTALSYVIATGYVSLFVGERVVPARWAGVLLITAGAILVGFSS